MKKVLFIIGVLCLEATVLLGAGPESEVVLVDRMRDALNSNDFNLAIALIDQGVDINSTNEYDDTALIVAAYEGDTDIVRLLLDKEADPNKQKIGRASCRERV